MEVDEPSVAPIRRRSSFFERRLSIPVAPDLNDENTQSCPEIKTSNKRFKELYKEKLENEYKAWKKLLHDRKHEMHYLHKKLEQFEKNDVCTHDNITVETLGEDVQSFMKMKPDLDAIKQQSIQLCKDVQFTMKLHNEYLISNDRIVNFVEKFVQEQKDTLIYD